MSSTLLYEKENYLLCEPGSVTVNNVSLTYIDDFYFLCYIFSYSK